MLNPPESKHAQPMCRPGQATSLKKHHTAVYGDKHGDEARNWKNHRGHPTRTGNAWKRNGWVCLPSRPFVIACELVGVHDVDDPSDLARYVDDSELLTVEADPDPERNQNAAKELVNNQPQQKDKL